MTMGVTKNIIPAIASTNALISAACVNECMKLLTGCNSRVDNYMQWLGQTRTSCFAVNYQREPDCNVCGSLVIVREVKSTDLLKDFRAALIAEVALVPESGRKDKEMGL